MNKNFIFAHTKYNSEWQLIIKEVTKHQKKKKKK